MLSMDHEAWPPRLWARRRRCERDRRGALSRSWLGPVKFSVAVFYHIANTGLAYRIQRSIGHVLTPRAHGPWATWR